MSEKKDIHEDLKPGYGDYAHAGVTAGLSCIPGIGGPISEFFSMVIAPPLEKRRDEWMGIIYQELVRLETEIDGFKIENLKENDQFISVLFYATSIAMKTHQEEKIQALRNAVINSAIDQSIDENMHMIFLNLIEKNTPLHLKLLNLLSNYQPRNINRQCGNQTGGFNKTNVSILLPEIKQDLELCDKLERDLVMDALLYECIPKENIRISDNYSKRVTNFGQKFLNFITYPLGRDDK